MKRPGEGGSQRDGTVHLVGNGRANHAGAGDPDVLDAALRALATAAEKESGP
jgi:hypothetical protein